MHPAPLHFATRGSPRRQLDRRPGLPPCSRALHVRSVRCCTARPLDWALLCAGDGGRGCLRTIPAVGAGLRASPRSVVRTPGPGRSSGRQSAPGSVRGTPPGISPTAGIAIPARRPARCVAAHRRRLLRRHAPRPGEVDSGRSTLRGAVRRAAVSPRRGSPASGFHGRSAPLRARAGGKLSGRVPATRRSDRRTYRIWSRARWQALLLCAARIANFSTQSLGHSPTSIWLPRGECVVSRVEQRRKRRRPRDRRHVRRQTLFFRGRSPTVSVSRQSHPICRSRDTAHGTPQCPRDRRSELVPRNRAAGDPGASEGRCRGNQQRGQRRRRAGQAPEQNRRAELAIGGYCPVSIRDEARWVRGQHDQRITLGDLTFALPGVPNERPSAAIPHVTSRSSAGRVR